LAIHSLFKNLFFSGTSQVIRLLANTILFVFIARVYGGEGFGWFTTSHAYYSFFLLVSDFGIETYILTQSRKIFSDSSRVVSDLLSIKLLLIGISAAGLLFLSFVLPVSSQTRILIFLLSIALIGTAVTSFLLAVLKSEEQFKPDAQINLIQNGIVLLGISAVWIFHLGLTVLVMIFTISRYSGVMVLLRKVRLTAPDALTFNKGAWSRHKNEVMTYGLHLVFGTLFFTSDSLLIPLFYNEQMVGSYQSVFKLAVLALMISDIITMTYLPTLSRLFIEDRVRWNQFANFLNKIIVISGSIAGVIFFGFPSQLLHFVYGANEFPYVISLMKIFGFVIIIRSAGLLYGFVLTSAQLQQTRMKVTFIATIMNIAANLIVIPLYGIIGAAVVSLITNLAVTLMFLYYSSKLRYEFDLAFNGIVGTMFIAFCSAAFMVTFEHTDWLAVISLSFFIAIVGSKGFTQIEKDYCRTLMKGITEKIRDRR
jgi:O-antigen/teichoic acid export membrane protein